MRCSGHLDPVLQAGPYDGTGESKPAMSEHPLKRPEDRCLRAVPLPTAAKPLLKQQGRVPPRDPATAGTAISGCPVLLAGSRSRLTPTGCGVMCQMLTFVGSTTTSLRAGEPNRNRGHE